MNTKTEEKQDNSDQFFDMCGRILFRTARPFIGDHFRAIELIELILAEYMFNTQSRLFTGLDMEILIQKTKILAKRDISPTSGQGLSKKQEHLLRLLDELPVNDRLIVELHLLENMTPRSVGTLLGRSTNDIYRVSKKLQVQAQQFIPVKQYHSKKGEFSSDGKTKQNTRKSRPFSKHKRSLSRKRFKK